jgi:hypothetical protein
MFRGAPAGAARPAPARAPRRRPVEVPVERGRAVVDLALHPIPPGRDLLVIPAGATVAILLARPSAGHYAAVAGDCPLCGGDLRYDPVRDAALCPGGDAAFRLDGLPQEGPRDRRISCFVVRRAGPRAEIDLEPPPDV